MTCTKAMVASAWAAAAAVPLLAFSCSSPGDAGPSTADASDATSDVPTSPTPDAGQPVDAGVPPHCTLSDGTDPVALCTQKQALSAMHLHAFDAHDGVAASWDPTTSLADVGEGGARLHTWTDDVGYASSCALYHAAAVIYGDAQLTPTLDGDLVALAPLLEAELAPLPDEYSGEPYGRLRVAAGGLRTVNDVSDGNAVDALADSYGRAIYARYFFALPVASGDAGTGDGGAGDAGTAEAGAADGGAGDAGTGSDGIIGRPASNGGYAYLPASAATAAYALVDLAVRNPSDPNQAAWQVAAESTFDHLYTRARDPGTGLYLTALVTSDDPAHDALDESSSDAANLLSDTTATVALALTRTRDLVLANASALPTLQAYPFGSRISDALASLNGQPSLYDGPAADAAASGTGFMWGIALDASSPLLTAKPTRANAFLVAVLYRELLNGGLTWGTELSPLTHTLIDPTPPNTSLFSVLFDQNAFLLASTRDFLPLDASAGPYVTSYQSAAVTAFVEGMNTLLPAQH